MSRFFANDSDTESGSESEASSEEVVDQQDQSKRFVYESSESEEEKRVVRSAKEKRWDEMQVTIKQLKNHIKINDWVNISNDFDTLGKQLGKAAKIVKAEGIPKFYFSAILKIQDHLNAQSSNATNKKMNAANARSMNTMKQKLRKHDKQYVKEMEAYNKDPYVSDDEQKSKKKTRKESVKKEESEEEFEEESEEVKPKKKKPIKMKKDLDSEEESDEDDDDDDSDSEEWDSDDDDDSDVDVESTDIFSRDFWVKKKEVVTTKKVRTQKPAGSGKANKPKVAEEKKKVESDEKVYTPEIINKKLKELIAMRGKRGTDRRGVVESLKILATKATSPMVMMKVKTALAAAIFDSVLNTVKYMPASLWSECLSCLMDMIKVLKENENVRLSEDEEINEVDDEDDEGFLSLDSLMMDEETKVKKAAEKKKREDDERAKLATQGTQVQYVNGNLYSFVQRLCAELKKSLQHIDPHTPDYVLRLKDEPALINLVKETREYYQKINKPVFERLSVLMYLELVYYHHDLNGDALYAEKNETKQKTDAEEEKESPVAPSQPLAVVVRELSTFLYSMGDNMEKMRALLCHVYHLSLHNHYAEARDLLLMSHVQDNINDADVRSRILFNRTSAQLGLCAFRVGETRQALDCLAELYVSNRAKELLAQGTAAVKFNERELEKEKVEKRQQYPYHMHMNLDVLESVHLLCAMIAEVPNTALYGATNKRKMISKVFRRLLEHHQGKAFNGPPENTRECVMAATTALQEGDWLKALANIKRLKMWKLLSNSEVVMKTIVNKVQEVALKTYLLTFGSQFVSVSLDELVVMFELDEKIIYRICCKMMVNEQLFGAWDQPSRCIIMCATQPTPIQKAALDYVDKAALFVEQNERLLEQRYNYYSHGNFGGGGKGRGYQGNNNYNDNSNSYNNSYGGNNNGGNKWHDKRRNNDNYQGNNNRGYQGNNNNARRY